MSVFTIIFCLIQNMKMTFSQILANCISAVHVYVPISTIYIFFQSFTFMHQLSNGSKTLMITTSWSFCLRCFLVFLSISHNSAPGQVWYLIYRFLISALFLIRISAQIKSSRLSFEFTDLKNDFKHLHGWKFSGLIVIY